MDAFEAAFVGTEVPGPADALSVIGIHPGQCGVLVHLADAPAAAFVVPHPDDHRTLHATQWADFHDTTFCRVSVPSRTTTSVRRSATSRGGRSTSRPSGETQVRRGYPLSRLAAHDWHLICCGRR